MNTDIISEIQRIASMPGITPEAKTLLEEAAHAQERGYQTEYDPSAVDALVEAGRGKWDDVPDAAQWVREQRE